MPQLRQCLNVGEVWVFCALLINMRNDCVFVCNYTKRLAFILVCETHLIHYSSSCPSLHSCLLSFLMDQDQMLTSIIAGIVFNCANCTRQAAREAMLVKRPSGWEPLSRSTGNWNFTIDFTKENKQTADTITCSLAECSSSSAPSTENQSGHSIHMYLLSAQQP